MGESKVVTITTQIKDLFQEVVTAAKTWIEATDEEIGEVRDLSLILLESAIGAVSPALKLVDREIEVSGHVPTDSTKSTKIRGILLNVKGLSFLLTRSGELYVVRRDDILNLSRIAPQARSLRDTITNDERLGAMATIELVLLLLVQLKEVFGRAMAANEARHAKMEELKGRLEAATVAFSPNPEQV
jgi:hypothetical protein